MKDLRNLPEPVLARLTGQGIDPGVMVRGDRRAEVVRFKPEVRANDDGTVTVEGYATVYDEPYEVYGGPPWGWSETVARGACARSVRDRDDVRFLVNHDGMTLARTRSKTLTLEDHDEGLFCSATLDGRSAQVGALASAMQRGDMDEMSMAFRTVRQEWDADYTERRILEVKLYDVSVVSFPANPATIAQVRNEPAQRAFPISLALAEAERLRLAARRIA